MEGAEDHGEDDAEGGVEARDGACHERGVLLKRRCHPGMRELEQCGAAGAEEERGLAVDAPGDGGWAEEVRRLGWWRCWRRRRLGIRCVPGDGLGVRAVHWLKGPGSAMRAARSRVRTIGAKSRFLPRCILPAMNSFRTVREAKEYLIRRILAQADRDGVPLSDVERNMLYFTETGWTLPNMMEISRDFDRNYEPGRVRKQDRSDHPANKQ